MNVKWKWIPEVFFIYFFKPSGFKAKRWEDRNVETPVALERFIEDVINFQTATSRP